MSITQTCRMTIIKRQTVTSVAVDIEKLESLNMAGGNVQ